MKRRALMKKTRPLEGRRIKVSKFLDRNHDAKKFDAIGNKVNEIKIAKRVSDDYDDNEMNEKVVEFPLLQKIDHHSFVCYFVAYGLFNFIYWIDMLSY